MEIASLYFSTGFYVASMSYWFYINDVKLFVVFKSAFRKERYNSENHGGLSRHYKNILFIKIAQEKLGVLGGNEAPSLP